MSSRNRQKGTAFETLVVQACRAFYPQAHRQPLHGAKDVGDIWTGDDRFILECKNVKRDELPQHIREAQAEAANVSPDCIGVVVTKRRGSADPMKQLVHMELGDFLRFARASE